MILECSWDVFGSKLVALFASHLEEDLQEDEVVEEFEEMDERDREQLIKELKMKWEELNSKYQKITHLVVLDTAGQVRRKEQLEAALTEIENDVKKLSRPGPILLKK